MLAVWVLCGTAFGGILGEDFILARGDANDDGRVDVSDAVFINTFINYGGNLPPCMNQADCNKDGAVSNTDTAYLLNWLYNGGPAPPSPGPFNTTCATTVPYISCQSGC